MSVIKLDISSVVFNNPWTVYEDQDPSLGEWSPRTERADSASIQASWLNSFKQRLASNSAIFKEEINNDNMGRGYSFGNSVASQRPNSVISHFYDREGTSNGNFKARVAAGEIVVSSYMSGRIHVESEPVLLVSGDPTVYASATLYLALLFPEAPGFLYIGRFYLTDTLWIFSHLVFGSGTYMKHEEEAWLPPLDVSAEEVFRKMQALDIDQALVTRKYADLNRGTLDLLTALAETPKLIDSIFNGIALVAELLKAAKKKEISVSASFARRKKHLETNFQREVQRLKDQKAKARPGQKVLSNRAYQRQSERAHRTFNEAMKRTSIELADALASIWMNFRYNIMPTSYLIDDLIDTNLFVRTFLIERTGYSKSMTLVAGGELHSYSRNCRVMMRRKIQTTGSHLDSASANFAVTAWELVPLSFVVDWFINIGDLISHLSITTHFSEQGATWAQRNEISSSVTNADGQKVTITGYVYTRTVIDPQQLTCLDLKWDMNANRYTDSLALIWGGIRSNLGKNRPR